MKCVNLLQSKGSVSDQKTTGGFLFQSLMVQGADGADGLWQIPSGKLT